MASSLSGAPNFRNESERRTPSRRSSAVYEPEILPSPGIDSGVGNGIDDAFLNSDRPVNEFPLKPSSGNFDAEAVDGSEGEPKIRTPDVNVYQQKKTLAQGMMDLALLSANANQLRYVLESGKRHPYYYASLALISLSLILQIAVGVGLILNSRYNVKKQEDMRKANFFNNFTVLGIFVVTTVNVFISAFGIGGVEADP